MTRSKHTRGKSRPANLQRSKAPQEDGSGGGRPAVALPFTSAVRETIESVIVAFVLAFLFRTFEAEAFVIPTGSMAPTLFGRHKDLPCPACGDDYQVSSSSEVDPSSNNMLWDANVNRPVEWGTCPMCRYTANIKYDPSYSGDRILVGKFCYQFQEPRRWDVVVFKYPGDAVNNYIKRLVGLPGETIRISHGDLWIKRGDGPFLIARKEEPKKLLAMLQPVFDNDYMPKIAKCGWPQRWRPAAPPARAAGAGQWQSLADGSFQTDGQAAEELWLRYEHRAPATWDDLSQVRDRPAGTPPRQLISDFLAYNTGSPVLAYNSGAPGFVPHWVGDLALQCNLEIQSAAGAAIVELVKGGRRFQCRFDVASGAAVLAVNGRDMEQFHPQAATAVRGPGTHEIIFCNVDDQLRLFVNGREVRFDSPTTYDSDSLGTHQPRQADLSPLGIATQGAALTVRHLRILRDIYYLADESREDESRAHPIQDFVRYVPDLSDPSTWPQAFREDNLNQVEFTLAEPNPRNPDKDQFFVCGDNSAQSKDSRLWDSYVTIDGRQRREYWVSRELLIGKALLIYWPHSFDRIPGTHIPFPFFPNFQRMQLVR